MLAYRCGGHQASSLRPARPLRTQPGHCSRVYRVLRPPGDLPTDSRWGQARSLQPLSPPPARPQAPVLARSIAPAGSLARQNGAASQLPPSQPRAGSGLRPCRARCRCSQGEGQGLRCRSTRQVQPPPRRVRAPPPTRQPPRAGAPALGALCSARRSLGCLLLAQMAGCGSEQPSAVSPSRRTACKCAGHRPPPPATLLAPRSWRPRRPRCPPPLPVTSLSISSLFRMESSSMDASASCWRVRTGW